MSKHPGPWSFVGGILQDRDENAIAQVYTDDTETRAVLLHAAEMWEAVLAFRREPFAGTRKTADAIDSIADKIESEISAGRKP